MKRRIVLGLIEVFSHILIFFFLKHQVVQLGLDWRLLLGLGVIVYLTYEEITKGIQDEDRRGFIRGILVTAATVAFFVSLQSYFSMEILTNYSFFLLLAGVLAYFLREPIADWVINRG